MATRGRPPAFKTPEEMQVKIDAYFDRCKEDKEPVTVTGLALALGFTSRQALINYEEKPEFVDTVKRASLRVEQGYEKRLHGQNAAGAIFALKNFDWSDKTQTEHSGSISLAITADDADVL